VKKGKCPKCGAGPRKIELWNTTFSNGERKTWLKCSDCYHRFDPPKSVKRVIPMSDILAAVDVLARHNKWRRCDDGSTPDVAPMIIGQAIDTVVKHFKDKGK